MISRRTLIVCLGAIVLATAAAAADAAGNGNGGGKGNGGGNGNGNNGNGNNGNGPSNGNGVGPNSPGKGQAKSDDESVARQAAPAAIDRNAVYRVRHGNGFRETLSKGRYVLQDNRGRTVVNRIAKPNDYARLHKLSLPDT
jgi:hypothetical protein